MSVRAAAARLTQIALNQVRIAEAARQMELKGIPEQWEQRKAKAVQ